MEALLDLYSFNLCNSFHIVPLALSVMCLLQYNVGGKFRAGL